MMSRNNMDVQLKVGSSGSSGNGSNKNVQSSEVSSTGGGSKNGSSRPNAKDRSAAATNIVLDDSSDDDNAEKIRVGKQYQATCPEMMPGFPSSRENVDEKALLVWTPTNTIDESQIDEYVRTAQEKYGYNMEQALGMLYWHSYDLKSAMEDLCNFMPYPNEWSQEDEVLFEQAFQFHGKSFNRIRQMLPDKSVGSLVKYYYSWKKTRTKTSVMDRQEQIQAKNGSSDNSSEKDSNENSDADDKNAAKQNLGDPTAAPKAEITASTSAINNCSGCGVACTEVHNTLHGKLCSSCHHHFKRTGILRPISAPKFFGKRSQPSDNGKYKKYPPKGIYFNHDDIVALAQASQNPEQNKQHDIVVGMERECASHWTRIQSNKQKLSKTRTQVDAALSESLKPDSTNRVSVRWTNDEYLLAVQGVRNHGKDFATIANILGSKTEAQIRTFFVNYRRRYNLDKLVREYDKIHGGSTKRGTSIESEKDTSSKSGVKNPTNQIETILPPVEIDLDEENTNTNANNEDVTMTPVSQ